MKKKSTFWLSAFVVMAIFSNTLMAQEMHETVDVITDGTPRESKKETQTAEKKIVITIRSTNADGSKNTSTMTITGDEAQNFDVKKYIAEQTKGKSGAEVTINKGGSERSGRRNFSYQNKNTNDNNGTGQNFYFNNNQNFVCGTGMNNRTPQGFLGVSEFYSPEKTVEGVRVNITRNSGAAKAGLKDDDVILQMNKTPINNYRDISAFMRTSKPGDKVEIVYDRDGKTATTIATLGQQQDAWTSTVEQEKEACLGVFSSSQSVDGQRGAFINDFTEVSAAEEVKMAVGDLITSVNGVRVKSHQDVWDEIAKYKPNNVVTVAYLREKATKQIKVTLKACKPSNKTDDENVIVVPKATETQQVTLAPQNLGRLELESFAASPNPAKNMVNISFRGQAVPTNVAFYDVTGKVLFQQNVNDFNGEYNQRFDVSEYAKGLIVVKVQQGDKVFSKQIVVN